MNKKHTDLETHRQRFPTSELPSMLNLAAWIFSPLCRSLTKQTRTATKWMKSKPWKTYSSLECRTRLMQPRNVSTFQFQLQGTAFIYWQAIYISKAESVFWQSEKQNLVFTCVQTWLVNKEVRCSRQEEKNLLSVTSWWMWVVVTPLYHYMKGSQADKLFPVRPKIQFQGI